MLASNSAAGFSQYAAAASRAAATPRRARTSANSSSVNPISAASTGQLDERVQRRRVRKMPMRPDPVGLAGHAELDQGQRRIVHRRGRARVLELAALGRRAADAVHLADAMARGVVAPDFPDGEIAGAGAGQRRRADQQARDQERSKSSAGQHHRFIDTKDTMDTKERPAWPSLVFLVLTQRGNDAAIVVVGAAARVRRRTSCGRG